MRPNTFFGVAVLLPCIAGAGAAKPPQTFEVCVTSRTTKSLNGAVPTYNKLNTFYFKRDVFVTTTPGKTITPPSATYTDTQSVTITDVTNLPQETDTFTNTDTITQTVTDNIPEVTITNAAPPVTVSVTTPTVGTTTVPTPNGWMPIFDTLSGVAAKRKRGPDEIEARNPMGGSLIAAARALGSSRIALCPVPGKKLPPSWPAAVTCYGIVKQYVDKTITITARKTTTVTAPTPTKTVSITNSFTVTNVVTTPDASVTVTVTQTDTDTITNAPTKTITTTDTISVTVPSYSATAYAICNPQNMAGTLNGAAVVSSYGPSSVYGATTNDADRDACCNSCAANPFCAAFDFYSGFPVNQQCYNVISGMTCSVGQYSLGANYGNGYGPDQGYFVGNGNCGFYTTSTNGA